MFCWRTVGTHAAGGARTLTLTRMQALARTQTLARTLAQPARSLTQAQTPQRPAQTPTAAFCVIGDEILSGKTQDTNTVELAQKCFALGVDLRKVDVVPDTTAEIVQSVRQLADAHDVVVTSGGIGPTHDDITYSAIARAFDDRLEHHEPTLARMRRIMARTGASVLPDAGGTDAERACARMALLPATAAVTYPCDELWVPVVRVRNVHVLPGVPRLFARLLTAYLPLVAAEAGAASGFVRALVPTRMRESLLAPILSRVQEKYAGHGIKVGSYPQWPLHAQTVVSVVGQSAKHVEACHRELCGLLLD
ncbi:hypothetical protein GGF43_003707 [Coemansia sp. RSA 2618]|nr:hypothetical protein GGF43_003707 [Coemansia sp. RSA 2618]